MPQTAWALQVLGMQSEYHGSTYRTTGHVHTDEARFWGPPEGRPWGGRSRPDTGTLYRTEFARILGFQINFTQLLFACTRCCNFDERFILRWRHGW
jgi:hypothetical protein